MRIAAALAALLLAASCGPPDTSTVALCKRMKELCGKEIPCLNDKDWADAEHDVGRAKVAEFKRCVAKAKSCPEFGGCAGGLVLGGHRFPEDERTDREANEAKDGKDAKDDGPRPDVRFLRVDAHATDDELAVTIDLEVASDMPHVAPHVNVIAQCGDQVDKGHAFFTDLSNAKPGERKVDVVKLFEGDLSRPPDRCEITLSLSQGKTPPARYCWRAGSTTPGACK